MRPSPVVLYLAPMDYGANAGVDAIGHGLGTVLARAGIEMRVLTADFRRPGWGAEAAAAIEAGVEARVDAMALYVLDSEPLAAPAATARAAGIPLFAFEKPSFPVAGAVVYPNFNHGVLMTEHLGAVVGRGAGVAIIGGPPVIDDIELVAGLVHGAQRAGLTVLGDPESERHRNVSDVAPGGREAALRVLEDFPRLDGLVPYNDETMLGALQALEETGRLGEPVIVSRNGTPAAVEAVRAGRTHGTWDIDCPGIGTALGELVVRGLAGGEPLEEELVAGPMGRMITAANAHRWVPWEQRVDYSPFRVGL